MNLTCGIIDDLAPDVDSVTRFQFWLRLHTLSLSERERFMRTAVLRECLPDPDDELRFEYIGAII